MWMADRFDRNTFKSLQVVIVTNTIISLIFFSKDILKLQNWNTVFGRHERLLQVVVEAKQRSAMTHLTL